APQDELQCKSQISTPVNDEIDFRISFNESDDDDYTIIYDKNSFSYKMISVNNLKTDSEKDNEKVIPLIPSPELAISCFDDLDFFKDFENEFPAIVYNDVQTSKSDLLTEPTLNLQHIDELNLNDETSMSEYDEEEQNILYFNDQFPFNIIRPDDLKLEKDNDNNEINIIQSLEDNEITHGSTRLFETSHDKITKCLRTGSFVINIKVKIVIWKHYANGMLFFLIMNLCAPFGVPFDPERYYKDGNCAVILWRPRMTKVIKGEFEKIMDIKVEDVSLTCDTQLEVFNNEVNRLSRMGDDLFTYEVKVANIPCDSKMDDDSEHEADDDMGGDDEVELTYEESSDDMDEVAKVFRININLFNFKTPMCKAFNEFNYLLQIDPDLLTKDIEGFKTYEDYKNDWIYEWNKDVPWVDENPWTNAGDYEWYKALEDSELKDEALRNKAIMEGFIKEDDDESRYEQKRQSEQLNKYDVLKINHEDNESKELCEVHKLPYVAVKEDEYEDLKTTRKDACRAYQEIFRIMDEGWMVTRAE
ncbi:hypothetical protein Tco_1161338, partial [Tanacetum coccineum]